MVTTPLEEKYEDLDVQMEAEKQRAFIQMVAGMAHEINTPLNVINTAIDIMARQLAEPKEITVQRAAEIAESLEMMRRNVERAHRLLQDFTTLSVSQLSNRKERLSISEAIDDSIYLILVNLKRSQIKVNFNSGLSGDDDIWIGNRGVLSQILINLLTNVERYAYPDGGGGKVDVAIGLADNDHYLLSVRDYGQGIPRGDLMKVFEPFYTTGNSIGGTGLGLSIVNDLVSKSLRGEIKIKSDLGEGVLFEIIFPRITPE